MNYSKDINAIWGHDHNMSPLPPFPDEIKRPWDNDEDFEEEFS